MLSLLFSKKIVIFTHFKRIVTIGYECSAACSPVSQWLNLLLFDSSFTRVLALYECRIAYFLHCCKFCETMIRNREYTIPNSYAQSHRAGEYAYIYHAVHFLFSML